MNQQDKIKERYKLISEKGAFLIACALRNGFSNCAQWVKKGVSIPDEFQEDFLKAIELQIEYDAYVKQIKVQNYKIISDSNFS